MHETLENRQMPTITAKELFRGREYKVWVSETTLVPDELFVIENYLRPEAKTLEAATGAGRILHALKDMGFTSLHGFDFVDEFIQAAKARNPQSGIDFQVRDARGPGYPDNTFEQLLYLQQFISSIDSDKDRGRTLAEAYRIAAPGAVMIVSFLSWDARLSRAIHAAYMAYLKMFRILSGRRTPLQSQPWLKLGGSFNFGALVDAPPYLYYFKLHEISELIRLSGFELMKIGSTYQVSRDHSLCDTISELARQPIRNGIYAVCRKPVGR